MNPRTEILAAVLRSVQQADAKWMSRGEGRDNPDSTPWMPFPLFDFIALVAESLPAITSSNFLEVGCGIGTRMLVARDFFGLDTHGFDRVPEYVKEAQSQGLSAETADALEYPHYGDFDLIWFNRPFNNASMQSRLEGKVWNDARSGAVVICANLLEQPPSQWWMVLEDWEVRRGIWQKP